MQARGIYRENGISRRVRVNMDSKAVAIQAARDFFYNDSRSHRRSCR